MGCGSSSFGTVDVEQPQAAEDDDFKKQRVLEWLESMNTSHEEQVDHSSTSTPGVELHSDASVLTQDEEAKFNIQSRIQHIPIYPADNLKNDMNEHDQTETGHMLDEESTSEASLGDSEKGSHTKEKKQKRSSSSSGACRVTLPRKPGLSFTEIQNAKKILYMKVGSKPSLQAMLSQSNQTDSPYLLPERCSAFGINLERHDLKKVDDSSMAQLGNLGHAHADFPIAGHQRGRDLLLKKREEFMKGFSTSKIRKILGLPAKQDANDIMNYSTEG
eukprot:751347-Hanusia_phi.AAC.1